ncbi:MAG: hypothetical protein HY231_00725 [Acidobacteria bacterium]|nr:hypothetical protein [Acidobacteriota bacterium]
MCLRDNPKNSPSQNFYGSERIICCNQSRNEKCNILARRRFLMYQQLLVVGGGDGAVGLHKRNSIVKGNRLQWFAWASGLCFCEPQLLSRFAFLGGLVRDRLFLLSHVNGRNRTRRMDERETDFSYSLIHQYPPLKYSTSQKSLEITSPFPLQSFSSMQQFASSETLTNIIEVLQKKCLHRFSESAKVQTGQRNPTPSKSKRPVVSVGLIRITTIPAAVLQRSSSFNFSHDQIWNIGVACRYRRRIYLRRGAPSDAGNSQLSQGQ